MDLPRYICCFLLAGGVVVSGWAPRMEDDICLYIYIYIYIYIYDYPCVCLCV
jgi:hypothetical protein